MSIPVVFFHIGYQKYLELCIRQTSKNNKVILIGDSSNKFLGDIDNVIHYSVETLECNMFKQFMGAYKHMHTGGVQFEIFCFVRWLAVRNLVKKLGLKTIFYTDSDNLIYSNLEKIYEDLGAPKLGIAVPQDQPPYRYVATGAVSYWNIEILDNFCQYILDFYTDSQKFKILEEKWDWHQQFGMAGGICDMTILWHFAQEQEHKVITKVSKNNSTFDLNINTAINYYYSIDEYETKDGVKNIFFVDDRPYCKNIITNENILFHNLQFQGNSKHLVEKYVRGIDISA